MPERRFTLEIVTPDRVVVSDDQVVSLVAPGSEGYLGVLAGHAPLMTELVIGEMTVRRSNGEELHIASAQGFMEVADNKVTILTEAAEKAEEIDIQRARRARERAEEMLRQSAEDVDHMRAEVALKRAINRLHVAEHAM